MAGASMDDGDNPVAINVTALVDIIFCLCVFFMISFKFKQIEGKFDTWLPKNKGSQGAGSTSDILQEIRVAMYWDEAQGRTIRKLGNNPVDDDARLQQLIKEAHDDAVRGNNPDMPVTVDADARVPWDEVMKVVNLCKRNQIDKIEFAMGAPPPVDKTQ
jgi:biopolymer transport protein ExbD